MNRQNLRNLVVIVVTAVAIMVALILIRQPWRTSGSAGTTGTGGGDVTQLGITVPPGQAAPKVGERASDFLATTITGETLTLSEAGQPVWLLFGATWCTTCRGEASAVQAVAEAYRGRVRVVSVYVGEDAATVQRYADRVGLTYPQIADADTAIAQAYAVMGIPAHFFIAADGTIHKAAVGPLTQKAASAELDAILGG